MAQIATFAGIMNLHGILSPTKVRFLHLDIWPNWILTPPNGVVHIKAECVPIRSSLRSPSPWSASLCLRPSFLRSSLLKMCWDCVHQKASIQENKLDSYLKSLCISGLLKAMPFENKMNSTVNIGKRSADEPPDDCGELILCRLSRAGAETCYLKFTFDFPMKAWTIKLSP